MHEILDLTQCTGFGFWRDIIPRSFYGFANPGGDDCPDFLQSGKQHSRYKHCLLDYQILLKSPPLTFLAGSTSGWSACWRPCLEDASSTKSSAKSKRLIQRQCHSRWFGCDCLSNSYKIWRWVGYSTHRFRSPTPTVNVVIYFRRDEQKFLSDNTQQ